MAPDADKPVREQATALPETGEIKTDQSHHGEGDSGTGMQV